MPSKTDDEENIINQKILLNAGDFVPWKIFDEAQKAAALQMLALQTSVANLNESVKSMAHTLDKYNEMLFNPRDGLIIKINERLSKEENYTRLFIGGLSAGSTAILAIVLKLLGF